MSEDSQREVQRAATTPSAASEPDVGSADLAPLPPSEWTRPISGWSVEWDGPYVVGGAGSRRLTPNFRLREFDDGAGRVRVHRELVSALQMLRNRFGRSMHVRRVDDDGIGAAVAGEPLADLIAAAHLQQEHRLFASAEPQDAVLRLRIPDPSRAPSVELKQALEAAFSVTAAYETSGDPFQQVTGNFDGAGLSFGPGQINFGTGTLVPVFREFEKADEPALRRCFDDDDDYREWLRVLSWPRAQQIAWANSVSVGRNSSAVSQPWRGYLEAVGRVPRFRQIMVEQLLRKYGAKLLRAATYLMKLKPGIPIDHLRCVCALYDLVIQQGSLDKADAQIRERIAKEDPKDQFELVKIAVEERGKRASQRWRADCVSRRLGILFGVPVTITESGQTSLRANDNFYLLRDVRIASAARLTEDEMRQQLETASRELATGEALT